MNLEQENEIESALNDTWEAIAIDILSIGYGVIDKEEVIELVLDANRIEMFGNLSEETLSIWEKLSFQEKVSFANLVFKYDAYGY